MGLEVLSVRRSAPREVSVRIRKHGVSDEGAVWEQEALLAGRLDVAMELWPVVAYRDDDRESGWTRVRDGQRPLSLPEYRDAVELAIRRAGFWEDV